MSCNSRHHRSGGCCHGPGHSSFPERGHHKPMFGKKGHERRFTTREEKIEQVENYITELKKELKGAEQHLERLKEEV